LGISKLPPLGRGVGSRDCGAVLTSCSVSFFLFRRSSWVSPSYPPWGEEWGAEAAASAAEAVESAAGEELAAGAEAVEVAEVVELGAEGGAVPVAGGALVVGVV